MKLICSMMLLAAAIAPAQNIPARQERQQDRIAAGVKSGALTAGETAKLASRVAKINREIRTERAANGGKLKPSDHRQETRQQNRTSRAIYPEKNDGQGRP